MQYTLYYSQICFFCHKVLAKLKGRDHDIQLASTHERDNRNELLAGGGKSQVPCLRIEDASGQVTWMYESDDIINYLRAHRLVA